MTLSDKQQLLYDAMSDIDSQWIDEAFARPRRLIVRLTKGIGSAVAVLALIIMLMQLIPASWLFSGSGSFQAPDIPGGLFFTITAHANSGTIQSISTLPDWMFSSQLPFGNNDGSSGANRFPDKPQNCPFLEFAVHLPGMGSEYILAVAYDDVISYAGIIPSGDMGPQFENLTGKMDPHIAVSTRKYEDSSTQQAFIVRGWFSEDKILTLKLYRRSDGILLQEQDLQIEYNSMTKKYKYTVLDSIIFENGGSES